MIYPIIKTIYICSDDFGSQCSPAPTSVSEVTIGANDVDSFNDDFTVRLSGFDTGSFGDYTLFVRCGFNDPSLTSCPPTQSPTMTPSITPTSTPSIPPTITPSLSPNQQTPTTRPTFRPTIRPTFRPVFSDDDDSRYSSDDSSSHEDAMTIILNKDNNKAKSSSNVLNVKPTKINEYSIFIYLVIAFILGMITCCLFVIIYFKICTNNNKNIKYGMINSADPCTTSCASTNEINISDPN